MSSVSLAIIRRSLFGGSLGLCWIASSALAVEPQEVEFFENRIRPVLVQECCECHRTEGKRKGGLALDQRATLLQGGDSGPAIDLQDAGASLLIRAIRHEHEDLKMPKSGAKLDDAVIADFVRWIQSGAPDLRDRPPTDADLARYNDWPAVRERRKQWWSFQPILPQAPPAAELLASDMAAELLIDVSSARLLKKELVGGTECEHLRLDQEGMTTDLWVSTGDKLPRRILTTITDMPGNPTWDIRLLEWKLNGPLDDSLFSKRPASDSVKVQMIKSQ